MRALRYFLEELDWMKIYNSPFQRPRISIYVGKTRIGVPYFLPRKWVNFDACGLGWKTKWSDTDFRHEWNPVWSFVFFGYQIAITFGHEHSSHYWESWLHYEYATDHKLSQAERLAICRKEFPNIWTVYTKDEEGTVNYYELILKRKYI